MKVGSLGKLFSQFQQTKLKHFRGLKISSSASYGSHKRHCGNEIIEFTGNDADTVSFNMTLSQILGVKGRGGTGEAEEVQKDRQNA